MSEAKPRPTVKTLIKPYYFTLLGWIAVLLTIWSDIWWAVLIASIIASANTWLMCNTVWLKGYTDGLRDRRGGL